MKIVIRGRIFATPFIRQSFYDEYGCVDYNDRTVLDVGADWGCTAKFFLEQGAKKVIAVDGHWRFAIQLFFYSLFKRRVKSIWMNVSEPAHYERLFSEYRPDIVKLDCEKAERHLLHVSDMSFNSIPEYIMEVHGDSLHGEFIRKFKENDYRIDSDLSAGRHLVLCDGKRSLDNLYIMHAVRRKVMKE